jgi:hypothetical protein
MRAVTIAMFAAAVGLFNPSAILAAPANEAIGEAVRAKRMIQQVRYYRRHYRRRAPYHTYRPGRFSTYRPYDPYGAETLHQLSQENQERAQRNIGPTWSDIRLKHDIALLGHLANGLGYYRFSYNGSSKIYVGVMAQEVQSVRPEAVMRGENGYLRVNYAMLGLRHMTWDQWVAAGGKIPGLND